MKIIFCILIGYLIGCFNPSYILGKIKGIDIREGGSRNAGASNAVIQLGKLEGALCALIDIAKPCFAIWLASFIVKDFEHNLPITGTFCVLGHIFPFYMGFKGGKGLACLGGLILKFNPIVFLIMLGVAVLIVLLTDYLFFLAIYASVTFPVVYGILTGNLLGCMFLFVLPFVVTAKHKENILRLKNGLEFHFSYLWNREKEEERVKANAEILAEKLEADKCSE